MSEVNPELKNIVEAALLVSGQPLTMDKLLSMFPEGSRPERDELRAALDALAQDYADRGIELRQIDRGFRIQSREKYAEWLGRLSEERPPRYSRALLETLAIIAYRQPVTRGDIEEIRGVTVSSEIIRTLTEREWIRQVGHRDVPGKPALYGTTRGFLEYFNLGSLDDLPTLAELRDLEDIGRELNLPLAFGDEQPAGQDARQDSEPDSEQDQATAAGDEARADGADERHPAGETIGDDGETDTHAVNEAQEDPGADAEELAELDDESEFPAAARGNE